MAQRKSLAMNISHRSIKNIANVSHCSLVSVSQEQYPILRDSVYSQEHWIQWITCTYERTISNCCSGGISAMNSISQYRRTSSNDHCSH